MGGGAGGKLGRAARQPGGHGWLPPASPHLPLPPQPPSQGVRETRGGVRRREATAPVGGVVTVMPPECPQAVGWWLCVFCWGRKVQAWRAACGARTRHTPNQQVTAASPRQGWWPCRPCALAAAGSAWCCWRRCLHMQCNQSSTASCRVWAVWHTRACIVPGSR